MPRSSGDGAASGVCVTTTRGRRSRSPAASGNMTRGRGNRSTTDERQHGRAAADGTTTRRAGLSTQVACRLLATPATCLVLLLRLQPAACILACLRLLLASLLACYAGCLLVDLLLPRLHLCWLPS